MGFRIISVKNSGEKDYSRSLLLFHFTVVDNTTVNPALQAQLLTLGGLLFKFQRGLSNKVKNNLEFLIVVTTRTV